MSVIGAKLMAVAELAESQGYNFLRGSRQGGKFQANDRIPFVRAFPEWPSHCRGGRPGALVRSEEGGSGRHVFARTRRLSGGLWPERLFSFRS